MNIINDLKDKFLMLTRKDRIIFISLVSVILIIVIVLLILIPKLFDGESNNNNNGGNITGNTVTTSIIGSQNGNHSINAVGNDYQTDFTSYSFDVYNNKKIVYTLNKDFQIEIRAVAAEVNGQQGLSYKFRINGAGYSPFEVKTLGDAKISVTVAHNNLYYLRQDIENPGNNALYVYNKKGNIIKTYNDMNPNASGLRPYAFQVTNETGLEIYATRISTVGYIYYGDKKNKLNICNSDVQIKIPSTTAINAKYAYQYKENGTIDFDKYTYEQGMLKDEYINTVCQ